MAYKEHRGREEGSKICVLSKPRSIYKFVFSVSVSPPPPFNFFLISCFSPLEIFTNYRKERKNIFGVREILIFHTLVLHEGFGFNQFSGLAGHALFNTRVVRKSKSKGFYSESLPSLSNCSYAFSITWITLPLHFSNEELSEDISTP